MEKREAVREYCLEKAIEVKYPQGIMGLEPADAEEVIEVAKKFEEYITGVLYSSSTTITGVGDWE